MSLTKIIIAFLLILVIFAGIIYFQFLNANIPKSKVTVNTKTFSTIVVQEEADLEKGLSGRKSLPQDQAMLFVLKTTGMQPFWMKNMEFPIDIIFMHNDKIVSISENAKPPSSPDEKLQLYQPAQPADKVLEINAGLSKKFDFKLGDKVKFDLKK